MREIKFRSWVENDNVKDSIYPFMNYRVEFTGGAINDIFATSGKNPQNPYGNRITYMQYTGLKDKNGREIYEGDIVMQLSERTYDSLTGVVKFIDGSYVIETADGKNGGYLFNELAFNVLIGNIYENPELLEEPTNAY